MAPTTSCQECIRFKARKTTRPKDDQVTKVARLPQAPTRANPVSQPHRRIYRVHLTDLIMPRLDATLRVIDKLAGYWIPTCWACCPAGPHGTPPRPRRVSLEAILTFCLSFPLGLLLVTISDYLPRTLPVLPCLTLSIALLRCPPRTCLLTPPE